MSRSLAMLLVLLLPLVAGCKRARVTNWRQGEIEVAPDEFVVVKYLPMSGGAREDASLKEYWNCGPNWELFELRAPLNGAEVRWRTCGWPIVLRLYEKKYYGVAFDRCSLTKPKGPIVARLRYFAQNGNAMQEIGPTNFPKAIAIQNVSVETYEFFCGKEKRTHLELARKADPNDICLRGTLTAAMWGELATGMSYEESNDGFGVSTNVLKDFARTNNLIRLKTIIRDPEKAKPPPERQVTQWEWLRNHLWAK